MANLKPFRALRFDPAVAGDVSRVVAPPYDVIDGPARDRLYGRSPHNVVRLILNRDADPYASAASTLREWRARGVLALDGEAALYLYAQRFALDDGSERERFGVIGALELEHFDTGKVRPHERTLEKAKSDRLNLVRACRTSLSPIFGLVSDSGFRFASLVPSTAPVTELVDEHGIRHRLWRIADPTAQRAIESRVAGKDVFIADGHHRYETALRYRDEVRASLGGAAPPLGDAPYDYVLAFLTTLEDPGLVILPTHRILQQLPLAPDAFRRALAEHFTVDELPWTDAGKAEMARRLENATASDGSIPHTITIGAAVKGADRLWVLSAPNARLPFPGDLAPSLRQLDVSALHQVVLARILGLPIGERGGTPGLSYTQDAAAAFGAVDTAGAAAAFFLPSTDVDALRAVGVAGLTMPEKSTFFYPKLLTGLVLYPVGDGAGTGEGEARTGNA